MLPETIKTKQKSGINHLDTLLSSQKTTALELPQGFALCFRPGDFLNLAPLPAGFQIGLFKLISGTKNAEHMR